MGKIRTNHQVLTALVYVCLVLLLHGRAALATLYVAAYDPQTKAIGLAYSSSGGNFWQTKVKGKGLIGAQARGLCAEATPEQWLSEGLSADLVGQKLYQQCHSVGWESYRLAIVTTDGNIESVIAQQGCTPENQFCGELTSEDFLIIGGGLKEGVLQAGLHTYTALSSESSLACRLYGTLEAVYAAGGEIKDFVGASITVDNPQLTTLLHWEARGSEDQLLPTLRQSMHKEGHSCEH